jgi:hypothetical protein
MRQSANHLLVEKSESFREIDMKLLNIFLLILILFAASIIGTAQQVGNKLQIPAELKPFILKGTAVIALKKGDLNGDGTPDYIMVLNKTSGEADYADHETDARPTLLIVRDRTGKLRLAARNDSIVTCNNCDAPFSNPFDGIFIEKNNFTIEVKTGSQQHLTYQITFNYSPRDKNWLLTRVFETDYDIYKDTEVTRLFTAPRNFPKITFADFASLDFRGKGVRVKSAPKRMLDVAIYLEKLSQESNGDLTKILVPVPRRIPNAKPLDATLKLLLAGTTEDEINHGLAPVVTDLKFYSARIRNRTAQINLKFENEEIVEESWEGSGFDNEKFVKAAELTLQLFGIDRVEICVNGIKNYTNFDPSSRIKCPFPMFPAQPKSNRVKR